MRLTFALTFALLFGFALARVAAAHAQDDSGFRAVGREGTIEVSSRDEPGSPLPMFRGTTTVNGALLHVLAVVLDDAKATEWAANVDEAKVLRKLDPRTDLVYSRTKMTWPVRDRDLVMKRAVTIVRPGSEYSVALRCVPGGRPEVRGAIRIKRCASSFLLRKVDAEHTYVDYRVHAEPGGSNPDWIVRMLSKSVPVDTLNGLARQLARTRGRYAEAMRSWASAR